MNPHSFRPGPGGNSSPCDEGRPFPCGRRRNDPIHQLDSGVFFECCQRWFPAGTESFHCHTPEVRPRFKSIGGLTFPAGEVDAFMNRTLRNA